MASNSRFCSQCGKPLADPPPPFCSECGASTSQTSGNVANDVETQIEATAEALRRVEKEKQTKKTKQVGIGCLVLIILAIVLGTCIALTTPTDDPNLIYDNLDAERLVKVGMKNTEVGELRDSSTRFVMLNFKPRLNNEEFYIDVPFGEGKSVALTPTGASIDSPFYAWIFFPTVTSSSRPTFIFFASNESVSEVINVSRFDCEFTVGTIILAGQHTEFPSNASICVK